MKKNIFAAAFSMLFALVSLATHAQDRRGNSYDDARQREYPFDERNPYDTRNRSFDNYNPYDSRSSCDTRNAGRYKNDDYRYANRNYPLDPRNPYDVRNQSPANRDKAYGRKVVVVTPSVVVSLPARRHHHGW